MTRPFYGLAFGVLALTYAILYGWLPDIPQRLRTVVAGAVWGALMWLGAADVLPFTLRSAGQLAAGYGSFTGLVATLVFLYVSAVTLIFGPRSTACCATGRAAGTVADRADPA